MSFTAPRFTDEGKALQAKAQAGTALKFTKMQLGDGELGSQAIAAMTGLVNPLITVGVSSVKAGNNYATVKSNFSNSGLTTGFYWREIGVFAADPEKPNDRNSDILYCYANAGSLAEYIPAAGSEIVEKIISIPCIIGDAENVSAKVASEIYATKDELNEHIDNKNNPHGVTAEQIGALTNDSLTKEIILNKINVLDIAHGGTGKETADEAFGSLGKNFGFPNAKNVGDNTDLNTLTKSGFYFSAGSKNTTNITNIPQIVYDTIRSYYELNILVLGLANRVTQIAVYPYNNSTELYESMWVRTGVGTSVNSLSWPDWRKILTDKNKPMGTYSGNGNLTSRVINTSGFGNVIVVYSQLGIAILTPNGAIVTENGGTSKYLSSTEAMYVNGTMTLATTNKTLNASGYTYSYECK